MTLFSMGTLIAFLAGILGGPAYPQLLVARVVQASGTAIMMPLLMTTLMTLVPAHSRGRMMGRVSIVISLAPAIGPSVAGLLLDSVGWRWIFGMILPIALVSLAIGAKWVHNLAEPKDAPIDVLSIILSAFGFGGLIYGLTRIGGHGTGAAAAASNTMMFGALAVGLVALALFVWRQFVLQRADDALLDLRVFRSRNFTISILMMLVVSLAFFGTITVLPLFLQSAMNLSALQTGLLVLPGALAMGLLGPVIGRVYDARGPRLLLVPGTALAAAVLWFYSTVGESTPIWVIAVAQTALSIGLALTFTPLFTASLASVQPKFYSHGSAVLSTIQQVAGAAGIALMIAVLSAVAVSAELGGASQAAGGAAGARAAFLIGAILTTATIVGAFLVEKPDESVPTHAAH